MNKLVEQISSNTPWIIAHRGYKQKYPENTLIAFQAAMDAGVPMIELDVRLSRDRKLIVIHDATLDRTTSGHGAVHDYTLEELKQLDAGSWFHPEFAGQRLPELAEVLELVNGRVITNIEIKSNAYEPHHPSDAIEKQVVDLVKRKKLLDAVLISSFNADILGQIFEMADRPPLALISENPADDHTIKLCQDINAFSWHPDYRTVTGGQVKKMHAAGLKVFPYTVDTLEDYLKMTGMNVDGVITNDPVSARKWLITRKAALPS
jgi:glycerophosphoryl diester phosphodiesterase